jgi:hypothetical protein
MRLTSDITIDNSYLLYYATKIDDINQKKRETCTKTKIFITFAALKQSILSPAEAEVEDIDIRFSQ